MYCRNCGQQANDNDQFCGSCGKRLENENLKSEFKNTQLSNDQDSKVADDATFPWLENFEAKVRKLLKTRHAVQIMTWLTLLLGAWVGIVGFLATLSDQYREDVFYGESSDVRNQVTWLGVISATLIISSILLFWKKVYGVAHKQSQPIHDQSFSDFSFIKRLEPEKKHKGKIQINHLKELLMKSGAPMQIILYLMMASMIYVSYNLFFDDREITNLFDIVRNFSMILLCLALVRNIPRLSKDSSIVIMVIVWLCSGLYTFREMNKLPLNYVILLFLLIGAILFFILIKIAINKGIQQYVLLLFGGIGVLYFVMDFQLMFQFVQYFFEYELITLEEKKSFILSTGPVFLQNILFAWFICTILLKVWEPVFLTKLATYKSQIPIRSKKSIVVLWIVLGVLVGGFLSRPSDADRRNQDEAINVLHALAITFSSDKYEAAASFGEYEVGESLKAGMGIGGLVGGVVGMVFAANSSNRQTRRRDEDTDRPSMQS